MRDVPAALIWVGVDPTNFTNYQNWYDYTEGSGGLAVPIPGTVLEDDDGDEFFAVPTAEDDLYFVGPQDTPPDGIYLPEFLRYGANPNAHATIPTTLLTLKSLHLVDNYSGTVSTHDNQHLGTLDLQTGSIGQIGGAADGVNDLVITSYMGFLGGTLNNSGTLGMVHITGNNGVGASANISVQTNAITIGSTIQVEGLGTETSGAGMAIFGGDYSVERGVNFVSNQHCSVEVGKMNHIALNPLTAGMPYQTSKVGFSQLNAPNAGKPYTVFLAKAGGWCKFVGDFKGVTKLVAEGSIWIETGVTVKLTDPVDAANDYSVAVAVGGEFTLYSNCKLIAPNAVVVSGLFETRYSGGPTIVKTAFIDGELEITATGTLSITQGAAADQFGRLDVTGEIKVTGTVQLELDASGEGANASVERDFIQTAKKFKFGPGAKLKVTPTNSTVAPAKDRIWDIIKADLGVFGAVPAPTDATLGASAPGDGKIVQIKVK